MDKLLLPYARNRSRSTILSQPSSITNKPSNASSVTLEDSVSQMRASERSLHSLILTGASGRRAMSSGSRYVSTPGHSPKTPAHGAKKAGLLKRFMGVPKDIAEESATDASQVHLSAVDEPVGCVAFHIKHCKDFSNTLVLKKRMQLTIRVSVGNIMKSTTPHHIRELLKMKKSKILIPFEEVKYFCVQVPRGMNDDRNKISIELLGLERLSESQRLLGRTYLHLFDIVRQVSVTDTYELGIKNLHVCNLDMSIDFAYGYFGYGFSNQLKQPENEKQKIQEKSLFLRIPPLENRKDQVQLDQLRFEYNERKTEEQRIEFLEQLILRKVGKSRKMLRSERKMKGAVWAGPGERSTSPKAQPESTSISGITHPEIEIIDVDSSDDKEHPSELQDLIGQLVDMPSVRGTTDQRLAASPRPATRRSSISVLPIISPFANTTDLIQEDAHGAYYFSPMNIASVVSLHKPFTKFLNVIHRFSNRMLGVTEAPQEVDDTANLESVPGMPDGSAKSQEQDLETTAAAPSPESDLPSPETTKPESEEQGMLAVKQLDGESASRSMPSMYSYPTIDSSKNGSDFSSILREEDGKFPLGTNAQELSISYLTHSHPVPLQTPVTLEDTSRTDVDMQSKPPEAVLPPELPSPEATSPDSEQDKLEQNRKAEELYIEKISQSMPSMYSYPIFESSKTSPNLPASLWEGNMFLQSTEVEEMTTSFLTVSHPVPLHTVDFDASETSLGFPEIGMQEVSGDGEARRHEPSMEFEDSALRDTTPQPIKVESPEIGSQLPKTTSQEDVLPGRMDSLEIEMSSLTTSLIDLENQSETMFSNNLEGDRFPKTTIPGQDSDVEFIVTPKTSTTHLRTLTHTEIPRYMHHPPEGNLQELQELDSKYKPENLRQNVRRTNLFTLTSEDDQIRIRHPGSNTMPVVSETSTLLSGYLADTEFPKTMTNPRQSELEADQAQDLQSHFIKHTASLEKYSAGPDSGLDLERRPQAGVTGEEGLRAATIPVYVVDTKIPETWNRPLETQSAMVPDVKAKESVQKNSDNIEKMLDSETPVPAPITSWDTDRDSEKPRKRPLYLIDTYFPGTWSKPPEIQNGKDLVEIGSFPSDQQRVSVTQTFSDSWTSQHLTSPIPFEESEDEQDENVEPATSFITLQKQAGRDEEPVYATTTSSVTTLLSSESDSDMDELDMKVFSGYQTNEEQFRGRRPKGSHSIASRISTDSESEVDETSDHIPVAAIQQEKEIQADMSLLQAGPALTDSELAAERELSMSLTSYQKYAGSHQSSYSKPSLSIASFLSLSSDSGKDIPAENHIDASESQKLLTAADPKLESKTEEDEIYSSSKSDALSDEATEISIPFVGKSIPPERSISADTSEESDQLEEHHLELLYSATKVSSMSSSSKSETDTEHEVNATISSSFIEYQKPREQHPTMAWPVSVSLHSLEVKQEEEKRNEMRRHSLDLAYVPYSLTALQTEKDDGEHKQTLGHKKYSARHHEVNLSKVSPSMQAFMSPQDDAEQDKFAGLLTLLAARKRFSKMKTRQLSPGSALEVETKHDPAMKISKRGPVSQRTLARQHSTDSPNVDPTFISLQDEAEENKTTAEQRSSKLKEPSGSSGSENDRQHSMLVSASQKYISRQPSFELLKVSPSIEAFMIPQNDGEQDKTAGTSMDKHERV
ncbi:uncharacterized protein [Scyliorhinus torazame]|uniref:uncharacterized protein isoform X2 n=1 Tax=Scyliorhinus torazame TaxID=75743 RepID=UPI003B59E876